MAVDQSNLISTVFKRADLSKLDALFDSCLTAAGLVDGSQWKIDLFNWIRELLCDAQATALMGPSFLFASAAFLPAPAEGHVNSHPIPCDRIQMTLRQLRNLGWTELLESSVPAICRWLESLHQPEQGDDQRERFLRGAISILEPAVFEVSEEHVGVTLSPKEFDRFNSQIEQLLSVDVPPAQIPTSKGRESVPAWMALLGCWLHRIRRDGDEAKTLATATADRSFNESVIKAIEMSVVIELMEAG